LKLGMTTEIANSSFTGICTRRVGEAALQEYLKSKTTQ